MNKKAFLNIFTLRSVVAMVAAGFAVAASADVTTHNITEFTPTDHTKTMTAEANSFYNPSMGFTGWLHTSAWGYAKLKKGIPVTIEAETQLAGFHPAIAVWQNAGNAKVECATGKSIFVNSYLAWNDVYEKKILADDVGDVCAKEQNRTFKMLFVTNAVDRDGWSDPVDAKLDNTMINRVLDGNEGKVSVTFTPEVNGIYKFVVGGINPGGDLSAAPRTKAEDIAVKVYFPE